MSLAVSHVEQCHVVWNLELSPEYSDVEQSHEVCVVEQHKEVSNEELTHIDSDVEQSHVFS